MACTETKGTITPGRGQEDPNSGNLGSLRHRLRLGTANRFGELGRYRARVIDDLLIPQANRRICHLRPDALRRPWVMTNLKTLAGVDEVVRFIEQRGMLLQADVA